ncbi:MAG: magnesium transporter CorA family protein [Candidatus Promineifilaceae bacterium]
MPRILYKPGGQPPRFDCTVQELPALLGSQSGLVWLDLDSEGDLKLSEQILAQVFKFHPLAIDDALREVHGPKLDNWGDYLLVVLQEAVFAAGRSELKQTELDIFLGPSFLVTYHHEPSPAVEALLEMSRQNPPWLERSSGHVLYRLVDEMTNRYFQTIDDMEGLMDEMEERIFRRPPPRTPEALFDYKRIFMQLRRTFSGQRELLGRLAREELPAIPQRDQVYFRDVYDHFSRLYELSENMRDLSMALLETYLSVVSNRLNTVMKTLTIVTSLFMPLTFITSFYGMNFFVNQTPDQRWTNPAALAITFAIMILTPLGMLLWMRRQGWL